MSYKNISRAGIIIGLIGYALAWYWFGWRLALVIFLLYYGHNLEKLREEE